MHLAINNPSRVPLCIAPGIAALLFVFWLIMPACAQTLDVTLPSGMTASASFHEGRSDQPAILLLHGFLQTSHSPPMSSLADNLASRGYTVLNPTITLGINHRTQTTACESAHTYTMEQEVKEIDFWVNWLNRKGYKNIVLGGFSSVGNLGILIYTAQSQHPAIKKSILISLNPLHIDHHELDKIRDGMNSAQQAKSKIALYSLGYCNRDFAATRKSYLSYAQYDESNTLALLQRTTVPTEIILGATDTILPANWRSKIQARGSRIPLSVSLIPHANHFFDGTSEFELSDAVEKSLMNLGPHKS